MVDGRVLVTIAFGAHALPDAVFCQRFAELLTGGLHPAIRIAEIFGFVLRV